MADKESSKESSKAPAQDSGKVEPQDLPPTHPNDPTGTTLTQDAGPDEDARQKAVEERQGRV